MLYPLIRKFFFALDAETAHGIGMHGVVFLNASGLAGLLARPVTPCPVDGHGPRASPTRSASPPGWTRTATTSTGWPRSVSASSRSAPSRPARSPATRSRACSASRRRRASSTAWASTTTASTSCWKTSRAAQLPEAGWHPRHQHRQERDTPIEHAADDYLICLDKVYDDASYVAVNISSPNTKNLRELQKDEALDDLLAQLKARQEILADKHGKYVPLALKIAPDLDDEQITAIADALRRHRMDGVIATNTTLSRDGVEGLPNAERGRRPVRRAGLPQVDRRAEEAVRPRWPANCRSSASAAS